ncbi:helix-turn-helix domain-containing protein [Candidatus Zixiibacteriota bacterium]
MNKPITGFSDKALQLLEKYNWPGNVRELHNAIERAVVVAKENIITPECFPLLKNKYNNSENQSLEALEKRHIQQILDKTEGNISRTADLLQIDRTTLYHKIEKYGLKR